MDALPDSAEADELELWSILVERYEEENFPIDYPDAVEAIRFRMEQENLRPKDLEPYLGGINGFRICTPAYS
jgi:HTH-type transcriptional regulator/antitoxin HigA